jgi:hypothetical protein
VSGFWEVRALDRVRVTRTRNGDTVVIEATAGQRVWSGEEGDTPYWTHKLGGVFFYESDDFEKIEIEILERYDVRTGEFFEYTGGH